MDLNHSARTLRTLSCRKSEQQSEPTGVRFQFFRRSGTLALGEACSRHVLHARLPGDAYAQGMWAGELWYHGGVADAVRCGSHRGWILHRHAVVWRGRRSFVKSRHLDRVACGGVVTVCNPGVFPKLAHSRLLNAITLAILDTSLGASELLPIGMLYQFGGSGTLEYLVSKPVNWVINLGILGLIVLGYISQP